MDDAAREALVVRLVLEYAPSPPAERPLPLSLGLRDKLGIDSMSLVSLVVRLGDELGVDVGALELELGAVKTVGDLVRVAGTLAQQR